MYGKKHVHTRHSVTIRNMKNVVFMIFDEDMVYKELNIVDAPKLRTITFCETIFESVNLYDTPNLYAVFSVQKKTFDLCGHNCPMPLIAQCKRW